jgi:hypothetical protein
MRAVQYSLQYGAVCPLHQSILTDKSRAKFWKAFRFSLSAGSVSVLMGLLGFILQY